MNVFDLFAKLSLDSSEYDKGLKAAKSAGSALGSGLAKVAGVGLKAIGAATTAVVGFGAVSVKSGAEFDKAMSQVAATMGVTTDEISNLRDFAMEMGATTKFSATESAEALNYMALAGYDAETAIGMLPNVLNLAAAGDMDLARASDMLTDSQTAFGISLERTTLMVDEMAKAASTGNTSVEQLGDAFLVVGGLAQELNGGLVETANGTKMAVDGTQELEIALTAMANAGVKGSEAGTHMRNMLLKLSSPTKDGTMQLERLGVTVYDDIGRMRSLSDIFGDLSEKMSDLTQEEKIQAISDLFNTRDIASAEALLNAVGQDWNDIGTKILDSKIPLDDVVKAIDKGGFAWEKFGDASETAVEKLAADIREDLVTANMSTTDTIEDIADRYDVSMEEAATAVRRVQGALRDAEGAAQKMKETQIDNLAGDVTLFQSALETLKITISDGVTPTLREFVQLGTRGIEDLTTAFSKFDPSPYLDSMGNMTEEGARAQAEWKKNREAAVNDLFATITDGIDIILDKIPDLVNMGGKLLGALATGIIENLDSLTTAATDIITFLSTSLSNGLPTLLSSISNIITDLLNAVKQNLPTITPLITDFIVGIAQIFTDNIDEFVEVAIEIAGAIGKGLIQAAPIIAEKVPDIIKAITDAFKENPEALIVLGPWMLGKLGSGIKIAMPLLKPIGGLFSKFITGTLGPAILTGLKFVGTTITNAISALPGLLSQGLSAVGTFLTSTIGTILTGIVGSIAAFFAGAEIGKKIGAWLFPGDDDLYAGYSGITGTLQMLYDFVVAIGDGIQMLAESIWEGISGFFTEAIPAGIASVMEFLNGLLTSISDWLNQVKTNITEGARTAIDNFIKFFQELPGKIQTFLSNLISKIQTFKSNLISRAREAAQGFFENLVNKISEIPGKLADLGQSMVDALINLPDKFIDVGKNIVEGLWNGIKNGWDWLVTSVQDLANELFEAAKSALGIASPSKKFRWIGEMVDEGFALGITSNLDEVRDAMNSMIAETDIPVSTVGSTSNNGMYGGFVQNLTINSPRELNPSETARLTKNANREMILRLRTT